MKSFRKSPTLMIVVTLDLAWNVSFIFPSIGRLTLLSKKRRMMVTFRNKLSALGGTRFRPGNRDTEIERKTMQINSSFFSDLLAPCFSLLWWRDHMADKWPGSDERFRCYDQTDSRSLTPRHLAGTASCPVPVHWDRSLGYSSRGSGSDHPCIPGQLSLATHFFECSSLVRMLVWAARLCWRVCNAQSVKTAPPCRDSGTDCTALLDLCRFAHRQLTRSSISTLDTAHLSRLSINQ